MTAETEAVQNVLDEAFEKFRQDFPEVARTLEAMGVSFTEYLATMHGIRQDLQTVSGNACTPF
jgi:hypothetical protein